MIEGKNKVSQRINGSKVIINLASGRFVRGQSRLVQSLAGKYNGNLLTWTKESQIGAPPHNQNPYAFKIFGFRKAEEQGHRYVLWLDSSVWAVRDTAPVFEHIAKHGYICQYAGHTCGRWSSDRQLEYFGVTRDEAMTLKMYGNAGFLGLDLWDTRAKTFLIAWEKAMKDGMFKGAWTNAGQLESKDPRCAGTRHDMLCGSMIANKLNMVYQDAGDWLVYAPPGTQTKESVIFKAQGLA